MSIFTCPSPAQAVYNIYETKKSKILNAKMPKQVRINFDSEKQQPSPISSVEMALPSLFGKIYREL